MGATGDAETVKDSTSTSTVRCSAASMCPAWKRQYSDIIPYMICRLFQKRSYEYSDTVLVLYRYAWPILGNCQQSHRQLVMGGEEEHVLVPVRYGTDKWHSVARQRKPGTACRAWLAGHHSRAA